jgi:hypothetical protein
MSPHGSLPLAPAGLIPGRRFHIYASIATTARRSGSRVDGLASFCPTHRCA